MSENETPKPKLSLRHEISVLWEETVLQQIEPYLAELTKESTDEFNSLIVDLLNPEIEMHDVQLPNGDKYSKAPVGYVIALNILIAKFLFAQDTLHTARDGAGVANVRDRRAGGESIGQWMWVNRDEAAPATTN